MNWEFCDAYSWETLGQVRPLGSSVSYQPNPNWFDRSMERIADRIAAGGEAAADSSQSKGTNDAKE